MNLLHFEGAVENISYIFHNTSMHSVLNTIMIVIILSYNAYSFYKKRNKTNHSSIQNEEAPIELTNSNTTSSNYNSIGISELTKQNLIKKLIEFENSEIYLEKNISLAKLSSYLNTNTKYLSHVIKIHSDRDFNNYINLLRIQYVANKLNDDSKFINYKISAMADEAGFSSHSKFTHFFKLNLGESPSSYISKIKKNKARLVDTI